MAITNTPLATVRILEEMINYRNEMGSQGTVVLDLNITTWLVADAKHLNHLNSRAMELGYEDAEAALKALADYEDIRVTLL